MKQSNRKSGIPHCRPRDTHTVKVRGWEKIFHASENKIKIRDKIDFKIKTVLRDKERHCIVIKESIQ